MAPSGTAGDFLVMARAPPYAESRVGLLQPAARLTLELRSSARRNAGTGDGISVEVDNGSDLATGMDALH